MANHKVSFSNETQHLYDIPGEEKLLGTIICNPASIDQAKQILKPQDFHGSKHQIIFEAMLSIAEQQNEISIWTLEEELKATKKLERLGGREHLIEVTGIGEQDSIAIIPHLVQSIKRLSVERHRYSWASKSETKSKQGMTLTSQAAEMRIALGELDEGIASLKGEGPPLLSIDTLIDLDMGETGDVIGDSFLTKGGLSIISGVSGEGKSLFTLEIAIHLIHAWNLWGFEIKEAQRVYLVQFENSQAIVQKRLRKMKEGLSIDRFPKGKFVFADSRERYDLRRLKDRAMLMEAVKRSEASVVMYDPLSSLSSYNENANDEMRQVMDTLIQINRVAQTSAILVHHFGKPQEGMTGANRLRGATAIRDAADTILGLTGKKHQHKTLKQVAFYKTRDGELPPPFLLERDRLYLTHSVIEEDSLCPPEKVREILEGIGGRVETQAKIIDAIREEVGCAGNTAKKYLNNALGKTVMAFRTSGKAKGYRRIDL